MNPHEELEIQQLTTDLERHYRNGDKLLVKYIAGMIKCVNEKDATIKQLELQYLKLFEKTHSNVL